MSPPAAWQNDQTSLRRDGKKQGRVFERSGAVRVVAEDGFLVARLSLSRDSEQIRRLLSAPNAVPVWKHGGKLVGIRLLSCGDDRGHSGERHGCSTVTTERVVNDVGAYIGGDKNLKHKSENVNHGRPEPRWTQSVSRGPIRPPLAG